MHLSDTAVRKIKPTDKPQRVFDAGGLYLEVSPAGGKWWRLKYRFAGKEKRLSLGTYPDTGLADARAKRDEARKLLARGVDPGVERKATKTARKEGAANSFEVIAREWLAVKAPEWTSKQHDKERDRLQNHAFPWIGNEIGALEMPLRGRARARLDDLASRQEHPAGRHWRATH